MSLRTCAISCFRTTLVELGFKYNMTDISASFALWQWKFLENWRNIRKNIADQYFLGLKDIEGIMLPKITQNHSIHLFVIQLRLKFWKISRNTFIDELNKKGVGLAVHYKPIHQLSYYKKMYNLKCDNFPIANSLYDSIVSLPIYPSLKQEEIDYVISSIKEIYIKHSK